MLAVSAFDVPGELLPPLAVLAVPVPPPLGVSTEAAPPEALEFCPAWLFPLLATLETVAPLSTPVSSVVLASSEISAPLPVVESGVACVIVELVPRSSG